jgi:hypothetical protein
VAGGIIKPGHLIAQDASAEVVVHATAGGYAEKAFAEEDALQGRTIDTAYAADERVMFILAQPGDVIYGWLAGGETVTPASLLTSNGDGSLKVATGTDVVVAVSMETKDASDSTAVDERLKVRVL